VNMPGFTAEASVYRTTTRFRLGDTIKPGTRESTVIPQLVGAWCFPRYCFDPWIGPYICGYLCCACGAWGCTCS
jgi:hypothetical protein